jgi:hypothetical protein
MTTPQNTNFSLGSSSPVLNSTMGEPLPIPFLQKEAELGLLGLIEKPMHLMTEQELRERVNQIRQLRSENTISFKAKINEQEKKRKEQEGFEEELLEEGVTTSDETCEDFLKRSERNSVKTAASKKSVVEVVHKPDALADLF